MARPTFKDKLRKRKDLTPFIHNFVDTKSAASRKVFQSVMFRFFWTFFGYGIIEV
jgi:hypothetical protein